ncbi:hypothetical protein [Phaeovulum sp.]|uniref:hypothetical protein n=1 Tax=Phaeovulum sp. TaxID=2934796 RepID=UPI0039E60AA7
MKKVSYASPDAGRFASRLLIGRRILLIESTHELPAALRGIAGALLSVSTFRLMTLETLYRTQPDVILAPLLSDGFDIIDVGTRLLEFGCDVPLRAFCGPVPNRTLVRREVLQACDGLDFDLLEVGPLRN